jgi:ABC-2 type transport system permease protein
MISHPMHIYPDMLRRFFTYIIPVIFIGYYPTLAIFEIPDPFNMPHWIAYIAPLIGLGSLGIASIFWRFGIKHYQSTGT